MECRTQILTSFAGVVGINRVAVRMIGADFGVSFSPEWWQLFGVVESEWLAVMNQKAPKAAEDSDDGRS